MKNTNIALLSFTFLTFFVAGCGGHCWENEGVAPEQQAFLDSLKLANNLTEPQINAGVYRSDGICLTKDIRILSYPRSGIKVIPHSINSLAMVHAIDLTGNELESLPDEIVNMKYLNLIKIDSNMICNPPETINAFLSSKDSMWKATQVCGDSINSGTF